jgi:lysophospholipase L1-like esterase
MSKPTMFKNKIIFTGLVLFLSILSCLADSNWANLGLNKALDAILSKLSAGPDPDWANLGRYNVSDAILSKLPAGSNQVVFMGDSITDFWNLTIYFPNRPYVNRGISAQISPQMLVRFPEDVIELQPEVVVILAGVNDLFNNFDSLTNEVIKNNLRAMADLALAENIQVVMSSILPVCGIPAKILSPARILAINKWMKNYCVQKSLIFVDYYNAMVGSDGLMNQDLTVDCVHPNKAGYDIMVALVQKAIAKALNHASTGHNEAKHHDFLSRSIDS